MKNLGLLEDIHREFLAQNFYLGRLISFSKRSHSTKHPKHAIYFNANIFTEKDGKIWYGDLDITKDKKKLKIIARKVGDLYVLRERDGRFENEELSFKEVKEKAAVVIKG